MDAQTAMTQILANLKNAISRAQVNVAGTWSTWGTNGQDAASANLIVDQGRLNSLSSFQMQDVLNGDWTFDKWKQQANDVLSDIITQDSTAAQFSFANIVVETVTQSASDVVTDVKAAGDFASKYTTPVLILIGLVAIAVIAVEV